MIFYPAVFVLMLVSFAVQEFIPSVPMAQYATLLLPPVFFFAASVAVPFPVMLVMAFITGALWDARHLPSFVGTGRFDPGALLSGMMGDAADLASSGDLLFGLSIVLFGLLGMFMQGIRPLFKRGRLELPVLMVGVSTFAWLLMQYLVMTFLRGSLYFPPGIWTKMVTDSLLAMLASPLLFLLLYSLANVSRYEIRYEGLRYNFNGR